LNLIFYGKYKGMNIAEHCFKNLKNNEHSSIYCLINLRRREMKKNLRGYSVSLFLMLTMLTSIALISPTNIASAQGAPMTFTTGETIQFTGTEEMEFESGVSMTFGTGIQIQFMLQIPDMNIAPCDNLLVMYPPGYIVPSCSWWEVIDPSGLPLGEFHVDTSGPGACHVDYVFPGSSIPLPFPDPYTAEMKIDIIEPCRYYVVHEPTHWWPLPCTWWEIINPETREPTGFEFHVDWNNESCEFHIDIMTPGPYILPFPWYEIEARQKITTITPCDWFVILTQGFVPDPCSWWEIIDPNTGLGTGLEFHVDDTLMGLMFHVDQVVPDPLNVPPWYPTVAKKKIDTIAQCGWYKVIDLANIPAPCSWWRIITPDIGDFEFHVDISYQDGTFHVDNVLPDIAVFSTPQPFVVAEKKIDIIEPCDWFQVVDPAGFLPTVCSTWTIVNPQQWASVTFHVDSTDGISRFHVDVADQTTTIVPGPWYVTATPQEEPPLEWYIKPPQPDYAVSGVPDFDQKQDAWGPGQGTYTWCGPVAAANSLWWLDSEYESFSNPHPVPPPTISDSFPLVVAYGPWDDHDVKNVDPLVHMLAFLMDTDGVRTLDGHIGTRWTDMEFGLNQYIMQQGVGGTFEVHSAEFPAFPWIEYEIERCQDVVLFLEFYQFTGGWLPLYDNPSLEFGHFVTCAGVNSTTFELLISDPYHDAFEAGLIPKGHSPVAHPFPHPADVHNDTQYVSHDAYSVAQWIEPPPTPYGPGIPVWELMGYLQALGYDQTWHAFVRAAVVTSPSGVHDVAVTNVITSKTGCLPRPTVGQGYNLIVNVTVENQGTFTETFDVSAHAATMPPEILIGTTSVTLNPGENTIVSFTWSTVGVAYGNYTISGSAAIVSGEIDTSDNRLPDGYALVVIPGDIDGNGKVELADLVRMANAYGSTFGDPKWNPNSDIDGNKKVGLSDLVILAQHYGQQIP
jgi:hypothetical protein